MLMNLKNLLTDCGQFSTFSSHIDVCFQFICDEEDKKINCSVEKHIQRESSKAKLQVKIRNK